MANASDNPVDATFDKAGTQHPRARAWLWRPWYAKLWWACIALYWVGKFASYWNKPLNYLYSTALAGYLNVLFYPFTALLVLGARFVLIWMEYHGWTTVAPTTDEKFQERSICGQRDPCSDPLDPRSGTLWIGSPENQANLFNQRWP